MRPLDRDILRLALPSILANITVPLVGMVDMAVAGHLSGSAATLIGGISIGAMLFDLLYWNFGFLRVGTGGLTAQAYGRGDRHYCAETLIRGVGFAWGIAFLMILLQWPFMQLVFAFVECSDPVRELASKYFMIRIWAAPATLSMMAFKGWFIGMQDTVRPMTCDLIVNFTNIFLSVGLAFGYAGLPALGFAGVAYGTLIAQWTGFTYAALAVWRRYGRLFREAGDSFASLGMTEGTGNGSWRAFFVLNRDLFIRSMCMIAVYIGFTMISARYGDMMLAVGAILMKLLMIFSYFTDGFAYAGEALTGRFIGEESPDGVRSTVKETFLWSLGVTVLFFLVYGVGGVPLLRLMTSDASVVEAGREFIPWLLLMPVIGCPAFTWDGIFTGATASKDLRDSCVWCVVGFFAVWFAGLGLLKAFHGSVPETWAIHLLMAAYFTHLFVRALYLTLRWRKAVPYT